MSKFITIDDLQVEGKKVLLRVDLNVPIKDGKITNNERIVRSAPTIKELADKKAKVIILTHLGRPKGDGYEEAFTVKPVADELSKVLNKTVAFADDCIGEKATSAISAMKDGEILVLENVRFHKAETKNDDAFTSELAKLGDIFVSDAFSAAHRAHSSTEGLAHKLPHAAGRLMEAELNALEKALGQPEKPVVAIVGGAKVSTKLDVLHNLVKKVDTIIIGGGMANTFLHAIGINVENSLCEKDMKDNCDQIIKEAKENACAIALPVDARIAKGLKEGIENEILDDNAKLPEGYEFLDAGPKSIENFKYILENSKTLIWNGPVGAFEIKPFNEGTFSIAKIAGDLTKSGKLVSIAGGGDTVSALQESGNYDNFSYVSTAGGAFLEWMEGKQLPGVICLLKK